MKSSNLYLALHLAPLALSAPVPLHQDQHLEAGSLAPHDITIAPPARWRFSRPKVTSKVLSFPDDDQSLPFDNRPVKPTSSSQPSKVLEIERPLTTEYLLSLRQGEDREAGKETKQHHHDSDHSAQRGLDMEDAYDFTELEISIAIPTSSRLGTPCQYARLSRERNDMLVVFLAIAFLLVVLMMEAWSSLCRSVRRVLYLQGAIRLEDDEDLSHEPLSIRYCGEDSETGEDEKADGHIEAQDSTTGQ